MVPTVAVFTAGSDRHNVTLMLDFWLINCAGKSYAGHFTVSLNATWYDRA